jgi:hypothetical protein
MVSKTETVTFDLGYNNEECDHVHWDVIEVTNGNAVMSPPSERHSSVFSVAPCPTCTPGSFTFRIKIIPNHGSHTIWTNELRYEKIYYCFKTNYSLPALS